MTKHKVVNLDPTETAMLELLNSDIATKKKKLEEIQVAVRKNNAQLQQIQQLNVQAELTAQQHVGGIAALQKLVDDQYAKIAEKYDVSPNGTDGIVWKVTGDKLRLITPKKSEAEVLAELQKKLKGIQKNTQAKAEEE